MSYPTDHAVVAEIRDALLPLARALDAFEAQFTREELASLDYETHLIGGGISLADCRRARALLRA